ncbi:MAG: hypothetical protein R3B13_10360 [Polyangiaceae bacterium]
MRTILKSACSATLLLVACKSTPSTSTTSSSVTAEAPKAPVAATTAPTAPAPTLSASAAPSAVPVAASASAAASAAPASPCPEGARKDDKARYCITLPEKRLAVSYDGDDPDQGILEELEIAGDRVLISIEPVGPGETVASLKAAALKRIGPSLVESGDLPNGYWTDLKADDGKRIIAGVVVSKYLIQCTHWASDEKKVEAARAVCTSLRTF